MFVDGQVVHTNVGRHDSNVLLRDVQRNRIIFEFLMTHLGDCEPLITLFTMHCQLHNFADSLLCYITHCVKGNIQEGVIGAL